MTSPAGPVPAHEPSRGALVGATLALFLVWSHTFLAFELVLAPEAGAPPMDWLDLTVARFAPVAAFVVPWCLFARRRECVAAIRAHPWRLLVGAALAVPIYNSV